MKINLSPIVVGDVYSLEINIPQELSSESIESLKSEISKLIQYENELHFTYFGSDGLDYWIY